MRRVAERRTEERRIERAACKLSSSSVTEARCSPNFLCVRGREARLVEASARRARALQRTSAIAAYASTCEASSSAPAAMAGNGALLLPAALPRGGSGCSCDVPGALPAGETGAGLDGNSRPNGALAGVSGSSGALPGASGSSGCSFDPDGAWTGGSAALLEAISSLLTLLKAGHARSSRSGRCASVLNGSRYACSFLFFPLRPEDRSNTLVIIRGRQRSALAPVIDAGLWRALSMVMSSGEHPHCARRT